MSSVAGRSVVQTSRVVIVEGSVESALRPDHLAAISHTSKMGWA